MSSAALIGSVISFTGLALFFLISKNYTFKAIDFNTSQIDNDRIPYLSEDNAKYYNKFYDERASKKQSKYDIYLANIVNKFNLLFVHEKFEDRQFILNEYLGELGPKKVKENSNFILHENEAILLDGPEKDHFNDKEILKMLKHIRFEIENLNTDSFTWRCNDNER